MIEARTPTTGAEAPSDAARTSSGRPHSTAAGTLNKFCWIEGISKPRAMAGQLEITEATSWRLSTTPATDSGRQGDPASCRPTRTTAEGCLPSQSQGTLFFFSLFHDADRRATKRLLHRVQHDAVEWRKRTSTSVSFVVQLARGEGTRRPGTGAPPKRSWRGPEEKWRPGETRARSTYTWSHEASVDRALHSGERSWEHGRGTPDSWTIIEHVEQKTIWTWTWAHVAALTTGRILVHNLLRASTQVLHTYSREWTWSWGESEADY